MSNYLKYALTIQNENSEERELLKLSTYIKSLFIKISCLNMDMTENFYGGLITKLRSLIYEYVLEKQNTICSPMHKYLYLLYELYQKLSEITFMNKKFLINFLFKRIFLFYDALHSQECNNVMIINDSIINICKGEITPIIEYCSYSIVNKFIFEDKNKLEEMDYFFKYIKECAGFSDISGIKYKIFEIFFIQLICIDDFAGGKYKDMLKDENKVKEFIRNKIEEFYKLNENVIDNDDDDSDDISTNSNINKVIDIDLINDEANISYLFEAGLDKIERYLLRYLFYAIINVFTPIDPTILDFFESIINKYFEENDDSQSDEPEKKIKLDELGNLFLKYNIQDVDIKIRNLSFLVDIILQKYYNIQDIPELDILKFPRLNILINRIFISIRPFYEGSQKEIVNAIFEHFIFSQFLINYIKYQVIDPEHYPIEIRYFVIYSYIKVSQNYLISNPFSAYITSIAFREIIIYLKLEKGFEIKIYNNTSMNIDNLNNINLELSKNKNSAKKLKRRKSTSRSKKHKKKNKKKSIQKDSSKEKISFNLNTSILTDYLNLDNESNSQAKQNNSINLNNDDKIDKPLKVLSKTLFNYLCFIYSMENKYKNFSEYFGNLYSFIDDYIEENVDTVSLGEDWTWIYIYSTKFIKNFELNKTYQKFEINYERTSFEQNVKLIIFLAKKIKYCNTQEHFLILDVIYNILININDLQTILKTPKYSEKFKKLNRALSYLSFNNNYSMDFSQNMSLINQELVGNKLFKITNLLFIESLDEYFWMPKTLRGYRNFNEFISILEFKFDKILYKKSLYSEQFLYGLTAVKSYISKFVPDQSNKKNELNQYIYSLEYFCKFKIPKLKDISDFKGKSDFKGYVFNLMELMNDEYDLQYDVNEKVDVLKNILISGEYDLKICFFLLCQLITNKKFEQNSNEIKLIKNIFSLMINKKFKFMINFLLTLYKSIEKYLFDSINEYVQLNFPDNYNFSKKDYQKFLDLFNPEKPVDPNNRLGKDIQIINNNWTLIKEELEKSDLFYTFLVNAEELNYPKSVMNLIEKYIFDIKRKYNIHRFSHKKYNHKFFKKYLNLYYKAYSHIEDNKSILDNYFDNGGVTLLLDKNNLNVYNNNIFTDKNFCISINDIINYINKILITLDANILLNTMALIENIQTKENNCYIYLRIIRFLYNIFSLNQKDVDMEQRKLIFSLLKQMEENAILEVLGHNNKLNGIYNSINYSLWLYELSLYLEEFEIYFSQCRTSSEFITNIHLLSKKLKNIFINKRRLPHLKRYLLMFEFRRFIFNLYGDKISEFYCLMDICKVYKSICETGISPEEKNNFRDILQIYCNNLIQADNTLLINMDKKLFLVPLKYYVKFFAGQQNIPFDNTYKKYLGLCSQIKRGQSLSNKILILKDKLKAKLDIVGINELLYDKIKKLGNKTSANNLEGLLLYTDFYLDQLLNKETDFNCIKPCESIKRIQIYAINDTIFNYLEGAINICIISEKDKYLRKYMPEIINLFFKINLAHINYLRENNMDNNNSQTQSQTLIDENINKYIYLLNKFRNEVSINKVKIIIPQLIICYQYENTHLYNFAIELLVSYAQENIDSIAFLLSSFLNFKQEDMKTIGIKTHRNDSHSYDRYKTYLNSFEKSKKFVITIKNKLSEKNQSILMGYVEFCQNLSILFFETKKMSNASKKDIKLKQNILINNVKTTLKNNKIILPTLENINKYTIYKKASIRNNDNNNINNNSIDSVLFLKELDPNIDILSSKEKPLHIRFKTCDISGNSSSNKCYDFLLKCDVNDITKEIKTFEIIDEINNIFKIKHYDTNESMSLKRYLIVPIAPTIILAEWLDDSLSFSSIIEEQSKKDLIYQDEFKTIISNDKNKPYIIPGSLANEEEKFNVLYNYYQCNFFDPNQWYNAKKKYAISTAIWSMTQFLVGLGDRHPGNIMINTKDGEVIHIDFGYVALKGLSLGVPEIVDFRLTFNLKKNLGLFEESGLFNYICVKVLKTFKEYYKTLSARIEYYQFDPLFDSKFDNKTFELFEKNDIFFEYLDDFNVKEKLKKLVVKNTHPENLERMYIWWRPWV